MPLRIEDARQEDIPRLVDIYFGAFQDLLRTTCFPETPSVRTWWEGNLRKDMADEGLNFRKVVNEDGAIVAWAQWRAPGPEEKGKEEEEEEDEKVVWPEEGNPKVMDSFFGQVREIHKRLLGDERHFYLEMICTAVEHQRKGAATLLIGEITTKADEGGFKAYLESSPSGLSTYTRLGFAEVDNVSVDTPDGAYGNRIMIRDPRGACS